MNSKNRKTLENTISETIIFLLCFLYMFIDTLLKIFRLRDRNVLYILCLITFSFFSIYCSSFKKLSNLVIFANFLKITKITTLFLLSACFCTILHDLMNKNFNKRHKLLKYNSILSSDLKSGMSIIVMIIISIPVLFILLNLYNKNARILGAAFITLFIIFVIFKKNIAYWQFILSFIFSIPMFIVCLEIKEYISFSDIFLTTNLTLNLINCFILCSYMNIIDEDRIGIKSFIKNKTVNQLTNKIFSRSLSSFGCLFLFGFYSVNMNNLFFIFLFLISMYITKNAKTLDLMHYETSKNLIKTYFFVHLLTIFAICLSLIDWKMFIDTIFAFVTAEGSVINKLRISGSKISEILEHLGINDTFEHRKVYLKNIIIENQLIDKVLMFKFYSPNSLTGEDVLEIDFHGSSYIKDLITKKLLSINYVRYAKNGEFLKRSLLNGKIDINDAQLINDLISSKTKFQHSKSIENYKNFTKTSIFFEINENLKDIMTILEANMDFSDSNDYSEEILDEIEKKRKIIKDLIENALKNYQNNRKIISGIKIAIIGDVNVGKSTLINTISNDDISIVSEIQGTTRDSVSVNLDFFGYFVTFTDTAGFRETNDIIELKGIEKSKKKIEESDIILKILNYEEDGNIEKIIHEKKDNEIIVLNKIDKISDEDIQKIKRKFNQVFFISLKKKTGIDELFLEIKNKIESMFLNDDKSMLSSFEYDILKKTHENIININLRKSYEMIYEDFRSISHNLSSLSIEIRNEDILDKIFSKFCVGK